MSSLLLAVPLCEKVKYLIIAQQQVCQGVCCNLWLTVNKLQLKLGAECETRLCGFNHNLPTSSVSVLKHLLTWLMLSLFTCPTCSHAERCQAVYHLHTDWSGPPCPSQHFFLSSGTFLRTPAPKLPTQHSGTPKTLFNGPFLLGSQTRTNTFIHGVPKMLMKQGPDTFTGVPLSWACVRQQWGDHSHRVMQGTTPMFPVPRVI